MTNAGGGDPPDYLKTLESLDVINSDGEGAYGGFQDMDPIVKDRLEDSKQDRELKKKYATWFFWVLVAQLALMNLAFIGVGVGCLKFDKWTLELYLSGTLFEVFGGVFVIIKSLFPNKSSN